MPVNLKIERTTPASPRTSLRVLAQVLASVQRTAHDLGRQRAARDPRFSGHSQADIERECELFVTELRYGSFEATLDVAEPAPGLFPEYGHPTLGQVVVDDLDRVAEALAMESEERVRQVLPDARWRKRVLEMLARSLPARSDEYRVMWGSGGLRPLHRPTREAVLALTGLPEGEFLVRERADDDVLVEGTCVARLGKDGRPVTVREWLDFSVVLQEDTRPYRTDHLTWGNRLFRLAHEIACSVAVEDHLIVVQYEPLGIRAYAPTREAAIRDFAEEFAFLWDDYAHARDEELTRRAVGLKRHLRELVREVEVSEASEGGPGR